MIESAIVHVLEAHAEQDDDEGATPANASVLYHHIVSVIQMFYCFELLALHSKLCILSFFPNLRQINYILQLGSHYIIIVKSNLF